MMDQVVLYIKNYNIIIPCDKINMTMYNDIIQKDTIGSLIYTSNKFIIESELLKLINDIKIYEHIRDIYLINDFILNFTFYPKINLLNKLSGSINKSMYTIDNYAVKKISKKSNKIIKKKKIICELYNDIENIFGEKILKVHAISNIIDFYYPLKIIVDNPDIIEYDHIWLEKFTYFDDIIDLKFKTYIGNNSYKNNHMIDNFIKIDNFDNIFENTNTLIDLVSFIKNFLGDDLPNFIIFMKELLENYSKLNNYTSLGFSIFILKNNNTFKYFISDITITGNKIYMKNCIKRFINLF